MLAVYSIGSPGFSRGYAKSKKKKKKEKKKGEAAEAVANATAAQTEEIKTPLFSKILSAVALTFKKLTDKDAIRTDPVKIKSDLKTTSSPSLSAEQKDLVSLAANGHNIFFTGSAGSGKSTALRAIRDKLHSMGKIVQVLAPTGKVAIANEGQTTYTFAGWTPNSHKMSLSELTQHGRNPPLSDRLRKVDALIIDEISMVENFTFERLSHLLKAAHSKDGKHSTLPFGGVQIITTGDFCQLPPVKPFQQCVKCGSDMERHKRQKTYTCSSEDCNEFYRESDKWAFRSNAWEECNFQYVHLNTIFRQNDPEFINLLEKLRLGLQLNDADIGLLTRPKDAIGRNAPRLYARREDVRRLNDFEFGRLNAIEQVYKCVDIFMWNQEGHPELEKMNERMADGSLKELKDHRLEVEVRLKRGMQVFLQHNLDLGNGLYNGSQGKIVDFRPFSSQLPRFSIHNEDLPVYLPHYGIAEDVLGQFMKNCRETEGWPVVQFHNGDTRTIYPVCQPVLRGTTRPYSLLGRVQIPLTAAWALTIHKSQGMTLDKLVVDINDVFEEGHVYVALSRARSLDGLKVEGDMSVLRKFRGNPEVLEWLQEKFGQDKKVHK
ncbi:hypothetical protein MKX07_005970 [Trichoderma sp. CBMAI-0711]|uniref:ATP-dependent DNA helicase n=1 Tax=Trichoderma parareesei TaxID=858221 RepID=A0A2H3A3S3_TRIPA|nr:hypothetical protein MKX07_005970 [Trichoderma sp. CBMAI-0711]OTA08656.1 hypothetical protein A9Z42_0003780 [Trichoderma parareesei]